MANFSNVDYTWGESIDAAFFNAFAKRIMTPIRSFPAYKLGLIDGAGNIKRQPKTQAERRALSFLDKIALLFKRYISGRIYTIYEDFRNLRQAPFFIQALTRGKSYRFDRYYDMTFGFNDVVMEEKEQKKIKRQRLAQEQERIKKQNEKQKKKLEAELAMFVEELSQHINETEG